MPVRGGVLAVSPRDAHRIHWWPISRMTAADDQRNDTGDERYLDAPTLRAQPRLLAEVIRLGTEASVVAGRDRLLKLMRL